MDGGHRCGVFPTRRGEQLGVLLNDAGLAGCVCGGGGRRRVGEEDRDASAAAEDLRCGGKRKEEDATVEGGILRRRNEAGAAEPVRRLSSGVFAGEGANQRVPRGQTAC